MKETHFYTDKPLIRIRILFVFKYWFVPKQQPLFRSLIMDPIRFFPTDWHLIALTPTMRFATLILKRKHFF